MPTSLNRRRRAALVCPCSPSGAANVNLPARECFRSLDLTPFSTRIYEKLKHILNSMWTLDRIQQLIRDNVEESLSLEYKGADALSRSDGKKAEIVKDVSAFANSSGGVLIYGVAEFHEREQRHRPERIDPVNRREYSKEWLEQVIQSIQPRIDGIVIEPVNVENASVCYVVCDSQYFQIPTCFCGGNSRQELAFEV